MSAAPKKRLGELLLEAGVIDATQLQAALGHQRQWGVRLGQALVDLKLAREPDIVAALARKFGFEVARLDGLEPYAFEQALKLVPREFATRNNVFPMAADPGSITVAMSDPTNLAVVDELRFRTGRRVKVRIGGDREITAAVKLHYPGSGDAVEAIALDLEVDDLSGEPVLDPFGGGSNAAFEAYFGSGPAAGEPAAPVAPPTAPAAGVAPNAPAPATLAPQPRPPAPAPARPAAASPRPAGPTAAPAPRPAAPSAPGSALRPAVTGSLPATAARPAPTAAAPTRSVAAAVGPRAPARPTAPATLELEDGPEVQPAPTAPLGVDPEELTPYPIEEEGAEALLVTDLAPTEDEMVEGRYPAARPLSDVEVEILGALDRLASGAPAEPEIVRPAQAMAALIRLLIRRRIITEWEFLDELQRK